MVVAWLFILGDHVPAIPFVEVVGKVNVPLVQMGCICVKIGFSGTLKLTTEAGDVPWQPYVLVTVTV